MTRGGLGLASGSDWGGVLAGRRFQQQSGQAGAAGPLLPGDDEHLTGQGQRRDDAVAVHRLATCPDVSQLAWPSPAPVVRNPSCTQTQVPGFSSLAMVQL